MLTLIAGIDEFKGEWRALGDLGRETLRSLRRIATIESAGSSTRIEGAKLSDSEVETLIGDLGKESFQSRDEQEVAGYAYVMDSVQTTWQDLRISENILFQLHRDLLRYSDKDERHRGQWKTLDNHVSAFDAEGQQIGIVFEAASPFKTSQLMEFLLNWNTKEEADPSSAHTHRDLQRGVPRDSSVPGRKWKTFSRAHQPDASPFGIYLRFVCLARKRRGA